MIWLSFWRDEDYDIIWYLLTQGQVGWSGCADTRATAQYECMLKHTRLPLWPDRICETRITWMICKMHSHFHSHPSCQREQLQLSTQKQSKNSSTESHYNNHINIHLITMKSTTVIMIIITQRKHSYIFMHAQIFGLVDKAIICGMELYGLTSNYSYTKHTAQHHFVKHGDIYVHTNETEKPMK